MPVELIDLQENVLRDHPEAQLWAITSEDSAEEAAAAAASWGLTVPVLIDESGLVHADYAIQAAFEQVLFPQEWVVDASGTIVYASNVYDPDALGAVLD
ncbi:MAG: redoxin domain-containing protein [Proteobacteria bacterium]|nr:redoxin domain-containing protein [Pseudomonadota bacterium]MCP4915514.1 redoxin domain-containing protein [Pseudomonadota bacterium]